MFGRGDGVDGWMVDGEMMIYRMVLSSTYLAIYAPDGDGSGF